MTNLQAAAGALSPLEIMKGVEKGKVNDSSGRLAHTTLHSTKDCQNVTSPRSSLLLPENIKRWTLHLELYDYDEHHLSQAWKNVSNKNTKQILAQAERMEYALWRKWFQEKNKLRKLPKENLQLSSTSYMSEKALTLDIPLDFQQKVLSTSPQRKNLRRTQSWASGLNVTALPQLPKKKVRFNQKVEERSIPAHSYLEYEEETLSLQKETEQYSIASLINTAFYHSVYFFTNLLESTLEGFHQLEKEWT